MRPVLVLAVLAILAASALPTTTAQVASAPDAWLTLTPDEAMENDPRGILTLDRTESLRWVYDLNLTKPFTVIEVQGRGLGLERPRQLVPSLEVPETRYPLFHAYPNERVWEADAPSQIFHVTGTGDDLVLRIGVPGPARETLVLEVDTVPPGFDVGAPQNITPIGFYVETQTTEFALVDLQVREIGASGWIQNPTPEYHVLQKFPVQGLDADTDHEAQLRFEDWAGNLALSAVFQVRTAPIATVDPVLIRPVAPPPNATIDGENVTIRASLSSGAPIPRENIRFFFDLKERTDFVVHGNDITYAAGALAAERHVVSIEATNDEGGKGTTRWTFEVAGKGLPPASLPWMLLATAGVAAILGQRRNR